MQKDGRIYTYKHTGETPLEALERLRAEHGIATDEKMAYAGRLDPMAEGLLLVLVGDACEELKTHCAASKEYEVDILFGFGSDTGDVLGLIKTCATDAPAEYAPEALAKTLQSFVGEYAWEYPVFSSKTVAGKPLFMYYYEDKLDEIEIPKAHGEIYALEVINMRAVSGEQLLKNIQDKIAKLTQTNDARKQKGRDFRREEILQRWKEVLEQKKTQECTIATVRCSCSSGTYMRTLAGKIGEALNTKALAYNIKRTKIGNTSAD